MALWGVLKWYGSESANLLECLALYGYANLIWVPVAIASASPITGGSPEFQWNSLSLLALIYAVLNYIFVGIGFGVSALFLFRNM